MHMSEALVKIGGVGCARGGVEWVLGVTVSLVLRS